MDGRAIMAATIQPGAAGDTTPIHEKMIATGQGVAPLRRYPELTLEGAFAEWLMDKGYNSNEVLTAIESIGKRCYIAEPKRSRRWWRGDGETKQTVNANRRQVKVNRAKRLMRLQGEMLKRPFAHCLESGGMRWVYLRGRENNEKCYRIHVADFILGLLMSSLIGKGTPRGHHGLAVMVSWLCRLVGSLVSEVMRKVGNCASQLLDRVGLPC